MLEVKTRPQDAGHPVAAGKDPVEVAVIEVTRRRKRNVCQSRLFDAAAKPAAGENHNGPAVQPELSADSNHRRHMAGQRRTAQQDTGHLRTSSFQPHRTPDVATGSASSTSLRRIGGPRVERLNDTP